MAAAEQPDHPRDAYVLDGIEHEAAAFEAAISRGRLHHAWLLTGPEGIGKASFAYRAARRLLGAKADDAYDPLGSAPGDPVNQLVAARSHPDLMTLERVVEDGKLKKSISVDEARRLPEFFARSPALAPFRVAIIDAAEDMNVNAANAVLKTLEEPPPRGVLFLVSHAPGRLLPTLRSRCRRLAFSPWPLDRLTDFAVARTGLGADEAGRLAVMARGAPGRVLSLAAAGALQADDLASSLLQRLPDADEAALQAMADSFRGGEGANRFALAFDRLAERLRLAVLQTAGEGASPATERWARSWERLVHLPGEVEALNLDRADAFWSAVADLRDAARSHPIRC